MCSLLSVLIIRKNKIHHRGANGIIDKLSGKPTNARPGPLKKNNQNNNSQEYSLTSFSYINNTYTHIL
jgi:hypothetical protein